MRSDEIIRNGFKVLDLVCEITVNGCCESEMSGADVYLHNFNVINNGLGLDSTDNPAGLSVGGDEPWDRS